MDAFYVDAYFRTGLRVKVVAPDVEAAKAIAQQAAFEQLVMDGETPADSEVIDMLADVVEASDWYDRSVVAKDGGGWAPAVDDDAFAFDFDVDVEIGGSK